VPDIIKASGEEKSPFQQLSPDEPDMAACVLVAAGEILVNLQTTRALNGEVKQRVEGI